jgi:hypothetical protein
MKERTMKQRIQAVHGVVVSNTIASVLEELVDNRQG